MVEERRSQSGSSRPQSGGNRYQSGGNRPRGRKPGGRRYFGRRRKVCQFCANSTKDLHYKNVDLVRRLVTEQGKIRPRRDTGTCAKHQRLVARVIKRARHMAFVPFAAERFR